MSDHAANFRSIYLTSREREVLKLVSSGHSAKEAARMLGIAASTVERHVDNVRLKTRSRNRAHMIAQAMVQKLI
ncbi:helix-turn-helix transcriptional regulator [Novosphingobium resinovorum]|uniref:response regulator transcription factor n=1 Tax=Novosphingobium TaxID=165696 RepID=UPI001B3C8BEB|nr:MULTISPECIES: helix-turn-helix transcriptional regulator [Novosphingobium]MBF7013804.1 helix-turn-helix transcriptional regulator [Novosphingobium sp. HR1a]WJM25948.1 helix-turn-helix transcriptional regulator [Novosphingobium resinovorum]